MFLSEAVISLLTSAAILYFSLLQILTSLVCLCGLAVPELESLVRDPGDVEMWICSRDYCLYLRNSDSVSTSTTFSSRLDLGVARVIGQGRGNVVLPDEPGV